MHAGLPVDINTMDNGIFKAAFMRTIANLSPWLVPLIRVVKLWARTSYLNDPTDGTLNSYCLTLLSIFHLQQLAVPQLPPIWLLLPVPGGTNPVQSRPTDAQSADQPSGDDEVDSGGEEEHDSHSEQDTATLPSCEQPGDKVQSSMGGESVELLDLQQRKRPPSARRVMHKGTRPPVDTEQKIQQNASVWRSNFAPPPQEDLSLENVVMAFFVRLSSFLLARFRRSDDMCWRTFSTWSGTLFPCQVQKMKFQKFKGNVIKCMGKDHMTDHVEQVVLLRELLQSLRKHWEKSGGCMSEGRAASARVLDLAPVMVPKNDVSALREEFQVVSDGIYGEEAEIQDACATSNSDESGPGAVGSSWPETVAMKRKRMLDGMSSL